VNFNGTRKDLSLKKKNFKQSEVFSSRHFTTYNHEKIIRSEINGCETAKRRSNLTQKFQF
jgi:hypothetical protein